MQPYNRKRLEVCFGVAKREGKGEFVICTTKRTGMDGQMESALRC
jgi:hypothetical protein